MRPTILIIDDDEGIRESVRMALELNSYEVFTAENGQEGLSTLASLSTCCVVLLDLMMPVMNGWAFIDELYKSRRFQKLPVVIVTAYPNQEKPIGAAEMILKPIELDPLLACVAKYCRPLGL